jgi:hypothetical protein
MLPAADLGGVAGNPKKRSPEAVKASGDIILLLLPFSYFEISSCRVSLIWVRLVFFD